MTLSLRERLGSGVLLTARDVAALLNVDRSWVYAHARDLGAIHLGDGPRPRLRFDPTTVARLIEPPRAPVPRPSAAAQSSRIVPLLPIKGGAS
jgi:hypothetical protein